MKKDTYQLIWTSVYRVRVRHIHTYIHVHMYVKLCSISNNKPNETFYSISLLLKIIQQKVAHKVDQEVNQRQSCTYALFTINKLLSNSVDSVYQKLVLMTRTYKE